MELMPVHDPVQIRIKTSPTHKTKTYILLSLMLALGPIGNTIPTMGMNHIGSLDLSTTVAFCASFRHVVESPTIWTGMVCLAGYLICYMLSLSLADYSFVLPFTGITYAVVPLLGYFFLHENVSAARWSGIALIFLGVLLSHRTPSRTTEPGELN
jgi:drug/metabolite transporter (DMT)-like permease